MGSAGIDAIASLPQASDELLDQIIADLDLANSPDAETFKVRLAAHARSFAAGRYLEEQLPTVHDDRTRAESVAGQIRSLLNELDAFHPMINVLTIEKFQEGDDSRRSWDSMIESLEKLETILAKFGDASFATKQPNVALRHAVGGLMLLLEGMSGRRATVSARQSFKDKPPELSSPEARSIGLLLRVAQPDLEDTTIVNKITEIRRDFKDRPLTEFTGQLLLGSPARPLP